MQTIFVSNDGDDKNFGLTKLTPVRSWTRVKELCRDNRPLFLLEGEATLRRLKTEMDEAGGEGLPALSNPDPSE